MRKPWSITTTLRNPERLRDFLSVLKNLEGENWDSVTQKKFQILLIKSRKYGFGSNQFYTGLSPNQVSILEDLSRDISFEEAEQIFNDKNYKDPAMRGRQSLNPLKKLGFVFIKDGKLLISELGKLFLTNDYDLGEVFFRSFMKWQIPNPENDDYKIEDGYDVKPFIGAMHLIKSVNEKSVLNGESPKGLSREEFSLFVPTLINYQQISAQADVIINLRARLKEKSRREQNVIREEFRLSFAKSFLGSDDSDQASSLLSNLKDYSDNAVRYFRLTRYFYLRGNGHYLDLEPRRQIEIDNLLAFDSGKSLQFASAAEYATYISNIEEPSLPWETQHKLVDIIREIVHDIKNYERNLSVPERRISDYQNLEESGLKKLIGELRDYRRSLQERENHSNSQKTEMVQQYIEVLQKIYDVEDSSIALEKYSSLALHALNDAIKIQPNYPVGDDNEPTFTAPAGKPDIECYYEQFNSICEVTMLTSRDQWYNEGQPVMRHLRNFEDANDGKVTYCLFIAPSLHRDTINTFWNSIKYEYEGRQQRIIPLSISNFIELLKTLMAVKKKGREIPHSELSILYDSILSNSANSRDVNEWMAKIPETLHSWHERVVG